MMTNKLESLAEINGDPMRDGATGEWRNGWLLLIAGWRSAILIAAMDI
jgi:hypothetical protein